MPAPAPDPDPDPAAATATEQFLRNRGTNPQTPRQPVRRFAHRLFSLICFVDCAAGVLVEALTGVGRRQTSG
jgi:hypothetical protein